MKENKKKILFVVDWYLPGYKAGGPTRSMANICEHFGEIFDLYIITRNTDYMDKTPYTNILTGQWNRLENNEYVFYANEKDVSKKFYAEILKKENFDAVYIHGIFSWKFSLLPLIAAKSADFKKIILAPRGMLAPSALSIKSNKKKCFLLIAKIFGLFRHITFHATNKKEKEEIRKAIYNDAKVIVSDNLPRKVRCNYLPLEKKTGEVRLFSLSRIAKEKNILFAIKILSQIKQPALNIVYDIYGEIYDKNYWAECLELIAKLPSNIKVNYKGTVSPDKLDEVISSNHSLFMPTLGENFGHAILETLSFGRPVVISDKTQWKDLSLLEAGWDIPLENEEMFAVILTMLAQMDQKEFNKWCDGARIASEKFINIKELISKYEKLFASKY